VLSNSVVQVVVLADGNVMSPVLLAPSGSAAVDQLALKTATAARFEPRRKGDAKLSVGT